MFETSLSTEKLDAALAKVQGEIKPAIKDKENPHFRSSYADISSVWEAVRGSLSKHGVSLTQWPIQSQDGRLMIVTRVAHQGEWMKATFSIPVTKQDPQGYGSAITYARRFTLSAALGVAQEDDDGNDASQSHEKTNPGDLPHARTSQTHLQPARTGIQTPSPSQRPAQGSPPQTKVPSQKSISWAKEQVPSPSLSSHPSYDPSFDFDQTP